MSGWRLDSLSVLLGQSHNEIVQGLIRLASEEWVLLPEFKKSPKLYYTQGQFSVDVIDEFIERVQSSGVTNPARYDLKKY